MRSPLGIRDGRGVIGKCGLCEYRTVCGGSRTRVYGITGDPFAEDPACVYQPRQGSAALS